MASVGTGIAILHKQMLTKRENQMKLSYTNKELKTMEYATVSSRVEEFAGMGNTEAYNAIHKVYGDDLTDDVYRGLLIFKQFGRVAYYGGIA